MKGVREGGSRRERGRSEANPSPQLGQIGHLGLRRQEVGAEGSPGKETGGELPLDESRLNFGRRPCMQSRE